MTMQHPSACGYAKGEPFDGSALFIDCGTLKPHTKILHPIQKLMIHFLSICVEKLFVNNLVLASLFSLFTLYHADD